MSPRIVLTAHHCTTRLWGFATKSCDHSDEQRLAILGRHVIEHDSLHRYYTIPVVEVRSPPNAYLFRDDYNSHDFAMVILKHPAMYNEWVSPICLPHQNTEYGWKWVKGAGWGKTGPPSVSRSQSPKLKDVWLRVNPRKYKHRFMFGTFLSRKQNQYQDPCAGDSGYINFLIK